MDLERVSTALQSSRLLCCSFLAAPSSSSGSSYLAVGNNFGVITTWDVQAILNTPRLASSSAAVATARDAGRSNPWHADPRFFSGLPHRYAVAHRGAVYEIHNISTDMIASCADDGVKIFKTQQFLPSEAMKASGDFYRHRIREEFNIGLTADSDHASSSFNNFRANSGLPLVRKEISQNEEQPVAVEASAELELCPPHERIGDGNLGGISEIPETNSIVFTGVKP